MTHQQQQGAIGIDLGSWRSVIAVAKRGGVEVITNQANFRQTPSVVGYGPNERFIGQSGNVKMKTNFRDTVSYPTRLLGLNSEYPHLAQETKFIPARTVKGQQGKLLFQVNYQGQNQQFTAQQVVAAYINKIRNIIETNKLANNQAVLSVPSYYTQIERKALMDAAKIAELHVTRLLNESTAVALDYGIFRKTDLDPKTPKNVLFVDFGHSKLSAFACSFTKEKMTMLAQTHQRNLGCRDIDFILLEFYKKVFEKSSGGMDIFESRKAVVKLVESIERQRKILSANSEYTMNLEYLMEENDLNHTLKREEFEKLAEPVFDNIASVLEKIKAELEQKKITIHGIEMVGGGTRIPAFQKIVEKVFKMQPVRTLNSSESIAKGCALMAAMKSPLFKVAEYGLEEMNYYPIRLYWNFLQPGSQPLGNNEKGYAEKQTNVLFPAGCLLPATKVIKFSKKEGIELLVTYDPPVDGFNKYIAYYKTPAQTPKQAEFNVIFKLRYNENGIISLEECFLQEDYMEETKVAKPKAEKKEEKKDDKKDEKKKDEKKKDEKKNDKKEDKKNKKEHKKEEAESSTPTTQEQFEVKQSKKTRQTPLKYDHFVIEKTTQKDVENYSEVECKMRNHDKIINETYQRKNELESIIYNNKEKLASTYKNFVKPQDVPNLLVVLEKANTWLYDQGQNSSKGMYIQKIDEIKPNFEPIARRYQHSEELKESYYIAQLALDQYSGMLKSTDPKYSHITNQERAVGAQQIEKVKQILANSQKLQSTIAGWENPVTSGSEVNNHVSQLQTKIKTIMNKPVPAPPKEQKPDTANPANPANPSNGAGEKMDVQKNPEQNPTSDNTVTATDNKNSASGDKMQVQKS